MLSRPRRPGGTAGPRVLLAAALGRVFGRHAQVCGVAKPRLQSWPEPGSRVGFTFTDYSSGM